MTRLICIVIMFGLIACEKENDLSKARIIWGDWTGEETLVIYDNPTGHRTSTTLNGFEISFNHTNKGSIKDFNSYKFIWAIQDDPNVLVISPEPFSVDSLNELHFNTTSLMYIGDFGSSKITLHDEYITKNDSLDITTERDWVLTPK
jgi:hypothetical protein